MYCRHAINPTSPYRMELILAAAIKEAEATGEEPATTVLGQAAGQSEPIKREEDLASQLFSLNLVASPVDISCTCTRKCKTKLCPCFAANKLCNGQCHKNNNSCTNF